MSYSRSYDGYPGSGSNYRPLPGPARNDPNGRAYDSRYSRSSSRDRHGRSSPSRRYTPPHDRSRTPPRGTAGNTDTGRTREWDIRRERDNATAHDEDRRGRSPAPRNRSDSGYRDKDRETYRSPRYDSQSRSHSPRRNRSPYYGGQPSREVIMEGLPLEMVENDIKQELKQHHNVHELDDVRVIRDRQTKVSRGFGFLRFSSLDKSKVFMENNYPMIYLYGNDSTEGDSQPAKVKIAFSRAREDRIRNERSEDEWVCKICAFTNYPGRTICLKCQTRQIDMAAFGNPVKPSQFLNSGDSDVSPDGTPSQFLLFRGLEPTVTEDLLAKGAAKLFKPSGRSPPPAAPVVTKKGPAKVASTTGDANLGAKEGTIRRILLVRDRRSNESWRYGFVEFGTVDDAQAALTRYNSFDKFTISSKPVTVDYVHAGIFVPVFEVSPETERFSFSPFSNAATRLAYWDDNAYVSELVVSIPDNERGFSTSEAHAKSATDKAAAAAEKEGLVKPGKGTEAKAKKRKAEANAAAKQKKTVPAHLQFWSNRHAELHGVKSVGTSEGNEEDNEAGETHAPSKAATTESNSTPLQSFADLSKKCCYLCSRQFKTEAEVNKHERLSQLHRDNLKSEDLKAKAIAKMTKAGIAPHEAEEDTPDYRDRARERRAAFGSKKISLPMKKSASQSIADVDEASKDDQPAPPSKGASLLGKMGWAVGKGLGAQGSGMTAPIATDMYVQGVGLGAQGGKIGDAVDEAERNTKGGYSEFLERTKDKAKERFERMG